MQSSGNEGHTFCSTLGSHIASTKDTRYRIFSFYETRSIHTSHTLLLFAFRHLRALTFFLFSLKLKKKKKKKKGILHAPLLLKLLTVTPALRLSLDAESGEKNLQNMKVSAGIKKGSQVTGALCQHHQAAARRKAERKTSQN